jgi:hypothetical protein
MPSPLLVEASHLRKSYGDRLAVDDLSFTISASVHGVGGDNFRLRRVIFRVSRCYRIDNGECRGERDSDRGACFRSIPPDGQRDS